MTPTEPPPGRLHHLGFVVSRIADVVGDFARVFGGTWDSRIYHDPLQGVNVSFLQSTIPGQPRVELVEPAGEHSRVSRFLAQGGGFHHLCYEVEDLEAELGRMRLRRATVLRSPQPAAAFGGRRIAWVMSREKLLVEFVERQV